MEKETCRLEDGHGRYEDAGVTSALKAYKGDLEIAMWQDIRILIEGIKGEVISTAVFLISCLNFIFDVSKD